MVLLLLVNLLMITQPTRGRPDVLILLVNILLITQPTRGRPNVLILLADDLGYGDLSMSGHPTSSTPHMDRLLQSSLFLPSFYTASPVCSPSRASLLTGKPAVTTGIWPGVFYPAHIGGLSPAHPTLATHLASRGYSTFHLGKWHLGVGSGGKFLPTQHGFQHYLGVPYSHDMCPCPACFPGTPCYDSCRPELVSCPLYRDDKIVAQPVNLTTLTDLYTSQANKFITKAVADGTPFFLYMAYHHPHHPQFAGASFFGGSIRGKFGDSLSELDWSVGSIMSTVASLRQANNTLVVFLSDNGPSLMRHERGGCAGLLRCGKGTTYEGGVRVPAGLSWPGHLPTGELHRPVSAMDILPTVLALVDAPSHQEEDIFHQESLATTGPFPKMSIPVNIDQVKPAGSLYLESQSLLSANSSLMEDIEGVDNSSLMEDIEGVDNSSLMEDIEGVDIFSKSRTRQCLLYFPANPDPHIGPLAIRCGQYKAHVWTHGSCLSDNSNPDVSCRASSKLTKHDPPLLYDLHLDPGERWDIAARPGMEEVIKELQGRYTDMSRAVLWGDSEVGRGTDRGAAPCCTSPNCEPYPTCCDCK